MLYFDVWTLWPELQIYSQGGWFSINLKISFMSLGDQPMLALKISVTHFADLDILPILILKFYI